MLEDWVSTKLKKQAGYVRLEQLIPVVVFKSPVLQQWILSAFYLSVLQLSIGAFGTQCSVFEGSVLKLAVIGS